MYAAYETGCVRLTWKGKAEQDLCGNSGKAEVAWLDAGSSFFYCAGGFNSRHRLKTAHFPSEVR